MPDEEYITVAQASRLSGLSIRQVQWLLQHKVIHGTKMGRDWLLRPSAVIEYLKQERRPGRRRKDGT